MKSTSNISIIGLGVVGTATAIGFAKLKYNVIGIDLIKSKIDKINKLNNKGLRATQFLKKAILDSDISFVCVETPSKRNGNINLTALKKVCKDIARIIKNKKYHIIVIRSTIFPGTFEEMKEILERNSGKKYRKDFDVVINPEFLREKTAIEDFFKPSFIVVGAEDKKVGKKVMSYYKGIKAKKFIVDEGIAQMIKYTNNSFHSLKVAFTNEIAAICKKKNIDSKGLMELFCKDTHLNISPHYLEPGKAYGGRCIPKDLTVLQRKSEQLNIRCPIIISISESNKIQIRKDERERWEKKRKKENVLIATAKR